MKDFLILVGHQLRRPGGMSFRDELSGSGIQVGIYRILGQRWGTGSFQEQSIEESGEADEADEVGFLQRSYKAGQRHKQSGKPHMEPELKLNVPLAITYCGI